MYYYDSELIKKLIKIDISFNTESIATTEKMIRNFKIS